ncbi:hypothetical protein SAMN02745866_02258 [Alteromonadaceae bacterium Bs31]|nr:hypothetical protein SAMN02745866_02258 [Alteromonadaceae bacterium Bs31]
MKTTIITLSLYLVFSLSGCVFVEPKGTIAFDEECDTAYQRYYVGIDSNPGEGLVILSKDGSIATGRNIPATIGECGGDACLDALYSLARQFAAEAFVAGSFAFAANTASWLQKERNCADKPNQEAKQLVILEEDLGVYLAPREDRPPEN